MQKTISTKKMTKKEWLLQRRTGIGGSDVATILGLNKYNTPYQLWLDKTGQIEVEDSDVSEAAHFGNVLEEVVAKEFTERTGKKVRISNKMYAHKDYPYLKANIDRDIVKENAILECKTASIYLTERWEGDEIPEQYICQVQHYMNVLNRDYAYIAVLIGGQKFVWKKVERDQELIDIIQEKLVEFWEVNILRKIAPPIDGSQATVDFIKEHYKYSETGKEISLNKEFDEWITKRNELKDTEKIVKNSINEIENFMKQALGEKEAEIGITPQHLISWKPQTRTSIDSKVLKEKYPDIYENVLKSSTNKTLRIKEIN